MSCKHPLTLIVGFVLIFLFAACVGKKEAKGKILYNQYCASCHKAPNIDELPKEIWAENVLPNMFSRMQLEIPFEKEYKGPFVEDGEEADGISISFNDRVILEKYILSNAPAHLKANELGKVETITGFETESISLKGDHSSFISFLGVDAKNGKLMLGTLKGELLSYEVESRELELVYKSNSPITWFSEHNGKYIVAEVGVIKPSNLEVGTGKILTQSGAMEFSTDLHRPVHHTIKDLNGNGKNEIVVSEFGNITGALSLFRENAKGVYEKYALLNRPGCIRTIVEDMDKDGKDDLVVLSSQAREGVSILFQKEDLRFEVQEVLAFSPVYGSSWFEMVDYNKDGFQDIITVHGDNADNSYTAKPYHGMRIHLNNGKNEFNEAFFYPMYGATRLLANDFDKDGDIDFAIVSSFPDYEIIPERSFVYLENRDSKNFGFSPQILENPTDGRWFLMESFDYDKDGDIDIILSSMNQAFSETPQEFLDHWSKLNLDLLVLKNGLIP